MARVVGLEVLDFEVILNDVPNGNDCCEVMRSLACLNGAGAAFKEDTIIFDSRADMKVGLFLQMSLDCR